MNFKLRIVALLLLVMMMFTSCSLDSIMQMIPGMGGDTTTTTTTKWKPKQTTTTTTTVTTTPDEPEFSRADASTSKAELLERFTATPEEFEAVMDLLDRWLAGSLPAEGGDPTVGSLTIEEVDAMYQEFEVAFYHLAEQRTIATIIYYCDTSDEVASMRYLDTQNAFLDINDKYNTVLREMYLNSPYSAELFADSLSELLEEYKI